VQRWRTGPCRCDLRQDDLSAQFTDPWDSTQLFDSVAKAGKPGIGLPVDLGNRGIELVDLLYMQSMLYMQSKSRSRKLLSPMNRL